MLNSEQRSWVYQHAYLPEHLPGYVESISGAKPHLYSNFLCFSRKRHLIFIGYPLGSKPGDLIGTYDFACKHFQPSTVSIIAPKIWLPPKTFEKQPEDNYYRLDLPLGRLNPEVAYMVRRAKKEVSITYGEFGKEHLRLVNDFLSRHDLTPEQRYIFKHISHYLKDSKTSKIIEARKENRLVAFNIVDIGSVDYAFYLFNFRSVTENVPGASDLLFYEMVSLAQSKEKGAINLGLGIHPGIRRFKEKWGGVYFLPYASALIRRQPPELKSLFDKL